MNNGTAADHIDYDLHGIVGIRVVNASPSDARAVARQLGPIQGALQREPDIVIRFVDRLDIADDVRYLGLNDSGFTDDSFLVLKSRHKTSARVRIPFEQIGGRCEILCESGLYAVPLLIPIINLTALANGSIPLHAAAFDFQGTGVITTGWSKGGKTETLLAFMAEGAKYVGDEWVYLSGDGQVVRGIPEPVTLWNWHLRQMPEFRKLVGRAERARLWGLSWTTKLLHRGSGSSAGRANRVARLLSRLAPLLERQLYVRVPPERVFGEGFGVFESSPQKLIFVASHAAAETTTQPMDPGEVAARMVFSLQEERQPLMSYYYRFRFAFPDRANRFIEEAGTLERELLTRACADKEAWAVYHPYPVSIPSLFDCICPLITQAA